VLTLNVNGHRHQVDRSADTPLLWVLRDELVLKGTKYGCGIGTCGICTVHADNEPVRACVTAVGDVIGKRIVTIEVSRPRPRVL
jgi:isoquinoline 1-oxidoreductase alpha subunit